MAPLNVPIASVKVLSKSTRNTENSTSCPKYFAHYLSICENAITATERSKGSSFSSMLPENSTSCLRQAHFNKQSTLLNGTQKESIIRALMMIQELLWIPYACFSSKVALLSPPTLYQVRRDQALEKSMIRLLFVGLDCYHIPTSMCLELNFMPYNSFPDIFSCYSVLSKLCS